MARSKTSGSDGFASAFGAALDAQLSKRAMRPADLAKDLGVSPSYISRLASGTANASPKVVNQLASTLNLSPVETQSLLTAAAQNKGYVVTAPICPHCGKRYDAPISD